MEKVKLGKTNIEVSKLGIGARTAHPSGCFAQSLMSKKELADLLIFVFDKGITFWDSAFQYKTYPHIILNTHGIRISMDSRGRSMDNVFVERLWRSVKYEEVYLKSYGSLTEAGRGLAAYFEFYNQRRRHQGLDDRTPDEVYRTTLPQIKVAA
jgi:putative transposase